MEGAEGWQLSNPPVLALAHCAHQSTSSPKRGWKALPAKSVHRARATGISFAGEKIMSNFQFFTPAGAGTKRSTAFRFDSASRP